MNYFPILIIGAGPIGLSCGIAAKKNQLAYKIIDKGALVNSLLHFPEGMTFFSSAEKLEIGGLPFNSLSRRPNKNEALEYYRRVAQQYDLNLGLYETFLSVEKQEEKHGKGRFLVKTTKATYSCDFIINATGFYDHPVQMNIKGEGLEKVSHYFTNAHRLFQQKVAIVGASNSAVDVALEAYRKGAEVTLIVRGNQIGENVKYWIKPDVEARIKEGAIQLLLNTTVEEIKPNKVLVKQNGEMREIENDFLYAMTGYQPNFRLMDLLGIKQVEKTGVPEYDPETMQTNAKGIYVAGVVCGGKNTRTWFIENSRDHGDKILNHIKLNQ